MGQDVFGALQREPGSTLAVSVDEGLSGLAFLTRVFALALLPWVAFGVIYVAVIGAIRWGETGDALPDIVSYLARSGVRELAIGGVLAALSTVVLGITSVYASGLALIGYFILTLAKSIDALPTTIGLGLMLLLVIRFGVAQLVQSLRRRLETIGVPWVFSEAEAINIATLSVIPLVGTYHLFVLLVESRIMTGETPSPTQQQG